MSNIQGGEPTNWNLKESNKITTKQRKKGEKNHWVGGENVGGDRGTKMQNVKKENRNLTDIQLLGKNFQDGVVGPQGGEERGNGVQNNTKVKKKSKMSGPGNCAIKAREKISRGRVEKENPKNTTGKPQSPRKRKGQKNQRETTAQVGSRAAGTKGTKRTWTLWVEKKKILPKERKKGDLKEKKGGPIVGGGRKKLNELLRLQPSKSQTREKKVSGKKKGKGGQTIQMGKAAINEGQAIERGQG